MCSQCCSEPLALVELRCIRVHGGVSSVTALYRCPSPCGAERTIADEVPQHAAAWRLYRGVAGTKRWHLWIKETLPKAWMADSNASACGCADVVAYPDRVLKSPTTRERVCQMCRSLADKFEIKLPKGARS